MLLPSERTLLKPCLQFHISEAIMRGSRSLRPRQGLPGARAAGALQKERAGLAYTIITIITRIAIPSGRMQSRASCVWECMMKSLTHM